MYLCVMSHLWHKWLKILVVQNCKYFWPGRVYSLIKNETDLCSERMEGPYRTREENINRALVLMVEPAVKQKKKDRVGLHRHQFYMSVFNTIGCVPIGIVTGILFILFMSTSHYYRQ